MGRLRWLCLPVGIICAIGGCDPGHSSSAPAAATELRPLLTIHSDESSDHSFGNVGDILVSSTGDLYITQPRENRILVYRSDGTFERSIGRAGGGPGEF
ncbi:MAG TPA: 6-bladed beta-propeller, partial [Gemmatimonadales bacterium]|nr:6-bladed beta-propeller [Gemmatimonadales bacterium]